MNPRWAFFLTAGGLILVVVVLALLFPAIFEFIDAFAGELRFFWWVILLLALAAWFIWGLGRKKN